MNRTIFSFLSLVVAVGVGACAKNNNNPPTKPVPGPTPAVTKTKPAKKKTAPRSADGEEHIGKTKNTGQNRDVVEPQPAETKKTADAPKPSNPDFAAKADGKPGFVKSPNDSQNRLIDVRGLPPGTEVKDPYTNKTFLIPP